MKIKKIMCGSSLCSEARWRIEDIVFKAVLRDTNLKRRNGDMRFFSLSVWKGEGLEHRTSLCSTGVFRRDMGGGGGGGGAGTSLTLSQIITPNLTFGIALSLPLSLDNTSSVLHRKSFTTLILSGNVKMQVTAGQTAPPHISQTIMLPTCVCVCVCVCVCLCVCVSGGWRGGGQVGVKALDSSVERLWFNLQSSSRPSLWSLHSNVPQCPQSPSLPITLLRSKTTRPQIHLILVSLFFFPFFFFKTLVSTPLLQFRFHAHNRL